MGISVLYSFIAIQTNTVLGKQPGKTCTDSAYLVPTLLQHQSDCLLLHSLHARIAQSASGTPLHPKADRHV